MFCGYALASRKYGCDGLTIESNDELYNIIGGDNATDHIMIGSWIFFIFSEIV